jgi:mycothiol synthase
VNLISIALPEERESAFRLIYHALNEAELARRVASALDLVASGHLDSEGILVARTQGEIIGAMVSLPLPGAGGLVWLPAAKLGPAQRQCEDALVNASCNRLRQKGAKLAQALLNVEDEAGSLLRNGFTYITRLQYMRHDLNEIPTQPPRLHCETFGPGTKRLFQETLLRSYEGTLDCPEVNGVRTAEEILTGHQAQGQFRPDRWWLVFSNSRPAGVALAVEVREWNGWDLSYIGLVPEARGHGLGKAMVNLVLTKARAAGAAQVTLAVDVRNRHAINLYERLGFEPGDQRSVYLAFLARP